MICIEGSISLPASKSMSHRMQMLRFLANSNEPIYNLSAANDTRILQQALDSIQQQNNTLFIEDAGTPARFLIALLAATPFIISHIDGTERMRQRPMQPLIEALQLIGADIRSIHESHYLPLKIIGNQLIGGSITVDSTVSSQFVSALCLIGPSCTKGLQINWNEPAVSQPYIEMTIACMRAQGLICNPSHQSIHIPAQAYKFRQCNIEADWSAACFWYAAAIISDRANILLKDLTLSTMQGDSYMQTLAAMFGVHSQEMQEGILIKRILDSKPKYPDTVNLSAYPDLAVPFIIACACQYPSIRISGVHHLIAKESNRIKALQDGLAQCHIQMKYEQEIVSFKQDSLPLPGTQIHIASHQDHRIVMGFQLLTLKGYCVTFDNITCVEKSYPNFWNEWKAMRIQEC